MDHIDPIIHHTGIITVITRDTIIKAVMEKVITVKEDIVENPIEENNMLTNPIEIAWDLLHIPEEQRIHTALIWDYCEEQIEEGNADTLKSFIERYYIDNTIPLMQCDKMNNITLKHYYNIWNEYADQQDVEILNLLYKEMKKRKLL
jgi:hypothetical protein